MSATTQPYSNSPIGWQLVRAGLRTVLVAGLLGGLGWLAVWAAHHSEQGIVHWEAYRHALGLVVAGTSGMMLAGFALMAATPISARHRLLAWLGAAAMMVAILLVLTDWLGLFEDPEAYSLAAHTYWPRGVVVVYLLGLLIGGLYLLPVARQFNRRVLRFHATGWLIIFAVTVTLLLLVRILFSAAVLHAESGEMAFADAYWPDGTESIYHYRIASPTVTRLKEEIARLEQLEHDEAERASQLEALREQNREAMEAFEQQQERMLAETTHLLQQRLAVSNLSTITLEAKAPDKLMVHVPAEMRLTSGVERLLTTRGEILLRMEVDATDRPELRNLRVPENPQPERFRWFRIAEWASQDAAWHLDEQDSTAWILVDLFPGNDYPVVDGAEFVRLDPAPSDPTRPDSTPLGFEFAGEAQQRFYELTRRFQESHYREIGEEAPRLCILLDNEVIWAGTIRSPIEGPGTLSLPSEQQRTVILRSFQHGPLPAALERVEVKRHAVSEEAAERPQEPVVTLWMRLPVIVVTMMLPLLVVVWFLVLLGIAVNTIPLPGDEKSSQSKAKEAPRE